MNPRNFALALILSLALIGCEQRSAAPVKLLPTTSLAIGNRTLTLEIANDDDTRETGLMNRDSMPADRGMIFVFPNERRRAFWMKNTRIPLDILFLDRDGRIVSIHTMQPFDLTSTPSDGAAQYAIELNAGTASQLGLHAGDTIRLPSTLPQAR